MHPTSPTCRAQAGGSWPHLQGGGWEGGNGGLQGLGQGSLEAAGQQKVPLPALHLTVGLGLQ